MKVIFLILILLNTGCVGQNKNGSTPKKNHNNIMDTFDIIEFNKYKDESKTYEYSLKDGRKVTQFGDDKGGYYEYTDIKNIPKFKKYKEFYSSGVLKVKGKIYENDFALGVWEYYDEDGNLEKKVNYDKPFKYNWGNILDFIKKNKIDIFKNTTHISRNSENTPPIWQVTWQYDNTRLKSITINGITGEIIEEKFDTMEKL
ncbi:hypothetical protein [Aquimarina agarivorans]|uniref:hypothetical protein n=1 Tax=Aquimarina agarivorans TaxID=980584 RepID=UPI000248E907|nr:hypothetical protein [Aquimarina agarivorans]